MPSKTFTLLDGPLEVRAKWSRDELELPWFRIAGRKFNSMSELENYISDEADRLTNEIESAKYKL